MSQPAIAALHAGNVIEAIKITRSETGLGLKEAKEQVDAHLARDPELQLRLKQRANGGAVAWLFMFALALAAIIYFWPGRS